jgi:hypothetical protein
MKKTQPFSVVYVPFAREYMSRANEYANASRNCAEPVQLRLVKASYWMYLDKAIATALLAMGLEAVQP